MLRRVCIFCGSSTGVRPEYREAAETIAAHLARRRVDIVFGGGCVGLMGVVADTALAHGGHVIGVIPSALVAREIAHRGLPDLRVVSSMHERKALMASLSDAFIALPGGFRTSRSSAKSSPGRNSESTGSRAGCSTSPATTIRSSLFSTGPLRTASSGRKTGGSSSRNPTRRH